MCCVSFFYRLAAAAEAPAPVLGIEAPPELSIAIGAEAAEAVVVAGAVVTVVAVVAAAGVSSTDALMSIVTPCAISSIRRS